MNNIHKQRRQTRLKTPAVLSKSGPQDFSKDGFLMDFIYNGSMPPAVSMRSSAPEQENDFMKAVLNTIIEKDIFKRREIHNKTAFNKIVDFLFDSIGSYVSPNSIANTLTSEKTKIDNETVAAYLNHLAQSYLLSADRDTDPVYDGIRKYNVADWLSEENLS